MCLCVGVFVVLACLCIVCLCVGVFVCFLCVVCLCICVFLCVCVLVFWHVGLFVCFILYTDRALKMNMYCGDGRKN